ncbi:MAG: RNHCP domain-containing protein [Spirochaetaceae bacterium]|nr:RNHCP domain-containing protein [Spirochaetaceae bacterium]
MERSYFKGRTYSHSDTEAFVCSRCGVTVAPADSGTAHRDHCPHCLWSLHVDLRPGDRANPCRGPMEPVAVWAKPSGEAAVIHRCARCGSFKANRLAGDDSVEVVRLLVERARVHCA